MGRAGEFIQFDSYVTQFSMKCKMRTIIDINTQDALKFNELDTHYTELTITIKFA